MSSLPRRFIKSLPDEVIKPTGRRELWVNLLGTLIVLLLVNTLADVFLNYLTSNRGYFLVSYKWGLLTDLKRPVDWLVLGDSSCNQGVLPEILEEQLGGTALNLCTVGSMLTLNDVWMLETHIEQVGPPRHVVIVHVYDIWNRDLEEDTLAHMAKIPLSIAEIQSLGPPLSLTVGDQIQLFLHRWFPLYSANKSLEEWIREPVQAFQESREFTVQPDGFMPRFEAEPELLQDDIREHLKSIRHESVSISSINQKALERIQSLAEQHGIDVYIALSPISEDLYQNPPFRRHLRQVQRELQTLLAPSDRLTLIMQRPITFEADQMQNADHLIESAARVYTARLAEAIATAKR